MNKAIRRFCSSFFILISFFFITTNVNANSIKRIEMDVYIDKSGNAIIKEVWKANLNQGTEGYRPYTNMGNSIISNFKVTDDSNINYESLSYWNVNGSFDSKAYKSGIHNIADGIELCWGISKYGDRTYTLSYNISNFVTQYTDTQGIYFNFLDLGQRVENAKIIIHSDIPFSLDNSRIWAFGNDGSITMLDGQIILSSEGVLSSSQYMVGLVRFEENIFSNLETSNLSFDNVYEQAMSGVKDSELDNDYDYSSLQLFSWMLKYMFFYAMIILCNPLVLMIFVYRSIKKHRGTQWLWGSSLMSGSLDFGEYGKIMPSEGNIPYFREIPCNKDLERAYWVAFNYNVCSMSTLKEGIIGAILLKWLKNNLITVTKTKKGLFNIKDNNYAIDLSKLLTVDNEIEQGLFDMLKQAAGHNEILEAKEFEKWCNKQYMEVDNWFTSFARKEQKELEKQGLIADEEKEVAGRFGKTNVITVKKVSSILREDAISLIGLKKFLLDFSKISEREHIEVHIWEEYLIFAQMMGIADKVSEQFSKLYPNFGEISILNFEGSSSAVRNISKMGWKAYEEGKELAMRRARTRSSSGSYSGSSRSSGGGGRSYSSGGRSSRGSSGGGFR